MKQRVMLSTVKFIFVTQITMPQVYYNLLFNFDKIMNNNLILYFFHSISSVGLFVCMNQHVSFKATRCAYYFLANRTDKWFASNVFNHIHPLSIFMACVRYGSSCAV